MSCRVAHRGVCSVDAPEGACGTGGEGEGRGSPPFRVDAGHRHRGLHTNARTQERTPQVHKDTRARTNTPGRIVPTRSHCFVRTNTHHDPSRVGSTANNNQRHGRVLPCTACTAPQHQHPGSDRGDPVRLVHCSCFVFAGARRFGNHCWFAHSMIHNAKHHATPRFLSVLFCCIMHTYTSIRKLGKTNKIATGAGCVFIHPVLCIVYRRKGEPRVSFCGCLSSVARVVFETKNKSKPRIPIVHRGSPGASVRWEPPVRCFTDRTARWRFRARGRTSLPALP